MFHRINNCQSTGRKLLFPGLLSYCHLALIQNQIRPSIAKSLDFLLLCWQADRLLPFCYYSRHLPNQTADQPRLRAFAASSMLKVCGCWGGSCFTGWLLWVFKRPHKCVRRKPPQKPAVNSKLLFKPTYRL